MSNETFDTTCAVLNKVGLSGVIEGYNLQPRRAIDWIDGKVIYIDQRFLPDNLKTVVTDEWQVVAEAIVGLGLRGAPLLGVAAALAVAATAVKSDKSTVRTRVIEAIEGLYSTRPTAVNLFWALNRMKQLSEQTGDDAVLKKTLVEKALLILEDDRERCRRIGEYGSGIIPDGARILTVCNTGFLATGGEGTALAAVYRAFADGKKIHVYPCETRPLLQGARLTAWELNNAGIPFTLIVDSAAASLVRGGGVDLCIIGADRIAANGDTANKIGSYQTAIACVKHNIPYSVLAPESTIDRECPDGNSIPVEIRSSDEVTTLQGVNIAPDGAEAWNPAFDVVPAEMIDAIITENGVFRPPFRFN